MTLRVLHVTASLCPKAGGTTTAVQQMVKILSSKGVKCDIAATIDRDCMSLQDWSDFKEYSIDIHLFPRRLDYYSYAPSMAKWLGSNIQNYDLVHIHGLFSYVNGLASRIAQRKNIPYVVTPHGMASRYGMRHKAFLKNLSFNLIERTLLTRSAAIHFTSKIESEEFGDLGIAVNQFRIPLAVKPLVRGSEERFFEKYPSLIDSEIIYFLGRIDPIKNIELLISGFLLTAQTRARSRLVISGAGKKEYVIRLKKMLKQSNLDGKVVWTGHLNAQEKEDALSVADVLVMPSKSESFGLSVVEALSVGVPCVLTTGVALSDEIDDAAVGVKVEPNPASVSEGISRGLSLSNSCNSFSRTALKFVETHFSEESVSREIVRMYRLCVHSNFVDE
ncbi:MAG: glycosyltransferase [Halioglobus sp.]